MIRLVIKIFFIKVVELKSFDVDFVHISRFFQILHKQDIATNAIFFSIYQKIRI